MITCTAITFIILFFVTRSKKKKIEAENEQLKAEITRLNHIIEEMKNGSLAENEPTPAPNPEPIQ